MTDEDGASNVDKLREEARRELRHGDAHKAYASLQGVLGSGQAELRDYFIAGECALRLNLFSDAAEHLSKTIALSEETNNSYFLDQAYFWRAFAFFKLKKFDTAASDIAVVRHIDIPFYIFSIIPEQEVFSYTAKELEEMINKAVDN